jgi:plasmid stabilization system protein ParE
LGWSLQAEKDHEAIVEHIFIENMAAALEVGDRIKDAALPLQDFPELWEGRPPCRNA